LKTITITSSDFCGGIIHPVARRVSLFAARVLCRTNDIATSRLAAFSVLFSSGFYTKLPSASRDWVMPSFVFLPRPIRLSA